MSYCEHKTKEEVLDCKYCTSDNERARLLRLAEKEHNRKLMDERTKNKTEDAKGIPYIVGNRHERRVAAKTGRLPAQNKWD